MPKKFGLRANKREIESFTEMDSVFDSDDEIAAALLAPVKNEADLQSAFAETPHIKRESILSRPNESLIEPQPASYYCEYGGS